MPLAANSKLGPYEIKSPLGAGGMGEVYRARDSRLNRDVAVKILRTEGAGSSDLRSRFEREARSVAALNHPNIVAVYDFGIEQDQQYIVSELIEGDSLRSLLRGKVVPVRKLVDIATQIADGLAAAHTAGILHRDLKPENIMIAKDGRIKILDFGLARQARTSGLFAAGSQDDTVSGLPDNRDITGEGAVIGTPNYMSPEQALGHELDYRSDQFSFGLILYELASGTQAFTKTSTIETMAAIVREEPAPMEEKLPPPLRWIIDRCLAKEPEQRYESTRDLYRDLKNLREHFSEAYSSAAFPQVATARSKTNYRRFAAICLACIALAALLVYVLKPAGQNIGDLRYTPFATDAAGGYWSPDGKATAYTGNVNGISQVFIKFLNSPAPVQLTHEQKGAQVAGWSGDGSHIILFESNDEDSVERFYSLSTAGGEPEFIVEADSPFFALSRNGNALAVVRKRKDNLLGVAISDPVGSPFVDYEPSPFAAKQYYDQPLLSFSPDGKGLLLLASGEADRRTGWLLPYPAGKEAPKKVLPQLAPMKEYPNLAWMPDSRHLVVSMTTLLSSPRHLWLADVRSNALEPRTNGIVDEWFPRPSPDGNSLLVTSLSSSLDVVSLSVDDGSVRTVVSTGHQENMASWAAKQEKMVWVTDRSGASEIWLRSADGTDRPVVTADEFPGEIFFYPSLSPTGDRMIFSKLDLSGSVRLWLTSLSGGAPIRLTNADSGGEWGGSWSPDGSRFSYIDINAGNSSIEIVKTNGGARPLTIKSDCFNVPDWSPSGDWITCQGNSGWSLVTPDGKGSKALGRMESPYLSFARDGERLYGLLDKVPRTNQNGAVLFFLDTATLKQIVIKDLGTDFQPKNPYVPGIRFSMSPDGKSFLYSTGKRRQDIWMLKGLKQPSWLDRFALR